MNSSVCVTGVRFWCSEADLGGGERRKVGSEPKSSLDVGLLLASTTPGQSAQGVVPLSFAPKTSVGGRTGE